MPPRRPVPWRDGWAWAAVMVIAWAITAIVMEVHAGRGLQFDMDEAVHARPGQEYLAAWRSGRPAAVVQLLARPDLYPPLDGMLRGAWYGALGSSTTTARLYDTLLYALVAAALWWSARQLQPKASRAFAFLPVLALAVDPVHVTGAAMSMLEIPALFWTLLALALFVHAEARGTVWRHGLAGLAAVAAFFTRYDNGIVVMAALAASHLVGLGRAWRAGQSFRLAVRPLVWFALPILAFLPIWLLGFGQLEWLLFNRRLNIRTVPHLSAVSLLTYPAFLMNHPFTGAAVVVLALGLASSLIARSWPPRLAPYLVHLAIALTVFTQRIEMLERYAILFTSTVWLLASAYLAWAWVRWDRRRTGGRAPAVALAAALLVLGFVVRPTHRDFYGIYENTNDELTRAYQRVAAVTRPWERPVTRMVLFGRSDQRPGRALEFHLVSECERRSRPCEVHVPDQYDLSHGWPRGALPRRTSAQRIEAALAGADFVVVFGRRPEPLGHGEPARHFSVLVEEAYTLEVEGNSRQVTLTVLGP